MWLNPVTCVEKNKVRKFSINSLILCFESQNWLFNIFHHVPERRAVTHSKDSTLRLAAQEHGSDWRHSAAWARSSYSWFLLWASAKLWYNILERCLVELDLRYKMLYIHSIKYCWILCCSLLQWTQSTLVQYELFILQCWCSAEAQNARGLWNQWLLRGEILDIRQWH